MTGRIAVGAAALLLIGIAWRPAADGAVLHDPTRPPVGAMPKSVEREGRIPHWRLTSTLIGPARKMAVINGRTVMVGGQVNGAVLLAVHPGEATLSHDGRKIHLKLIAGSIKKAVKKAP